MAIITVRPSFPTMRPHLIVFPAEIFFPPEEGWHSSIYIGFGWAESNLHLINRDEKIPNIEKSIARRLFPTPKRHFQAASNPRF